MAFVLERALMQFSFDVKNVTLAGTNAVQSWGLRGTPSVVVGPPAPPDPIQAIILGFHLESYGCRVHLVTDGNPYHNNILRITVCSWYQHITR